MNVPLGRRFEGCIRRSDGLFCEVGLKGSGDQLADAVRLGIDHKPVQYFPLLRGCLERPEGSCPTLLAPPPPRSAPDGLTGKRAACRALVDLSCPYQRCEPTAGLVDGVIGNLGVGEALGAGQPSR